MSSKHLDPGQIRGLEKIGNVMFPGGEGFPGFSQLGCVRHLDRILDYMPDRDLKDLGMLLRLFTWMPRLLVRLFVWLLERSAGWPGPLGALPRTVRLGLRGLVMSLYYGDPEILKQIGYEVSVHTADTQGGNP